MSVVRISHEMVVGADALELARTHRAWALEHSPPKDVHAVTAEALLEPGLTLLTARGDDGGLLGMGGLRELDPEHGELKAMHVLQTARGRGLGRALVLGLVEVAQQRGYRRLSLETGTMEAFAAARSLYAGVGFTTCAPFGEYVSSPNSVCMTLSPRPAPRLDFFLPPPRFPPPNRYRNRTCRTFGPVGWRNDGASRAQRASSIWARAVRRCGGVPPAGRRLDGTPRGSRRRWA